MRTISKKWVSISIVFCFFLLMISYRIGYNNGSKTSKIPLIPMSDSSNLFLSDTGQPVMARGLYYCDPIITKDSLERFDIYDKNGEPLNPYLLAGEQYTIKDDGLYFKETENRKALIVGLDKDFVVLLSNSVLLKK